jgi:mono/diheme cytochrome c family protein
MLILAASNQRTIGLVIALIVGFGAAIYVLVNVFSTGKKEIGSEIELAPNRKAYYDDEELETKKLDLSLAAGVGTLAIIALALPLYWLGEPGRTQGYAENSDRISADRGGESFEELCAQCHGADAVGGAAGYTVLDEEGRFLTSVSWNAPALNTILYRFTEDEVQHVLDYGRPQSPMPAWGLPGGGPLTSQQVEALIDYIARIQLDPSEFTPEIQAGVRAGVLTSVQDQNRDVFDVVANEDSSADEIAAAREQITDLYNSVIPDTGAGRGLGDLLDESAALAADPDASVEEITAAQAAVDAALDSYIADLAPVDEGALLFNNAAAGGSYNCARCHTAGSSWDADGVLHDNPSLGGLILPEQPGGGGFGPSLIGVADTFVSALDQADFVGQGCSPNLQYGLNGVCEPSGQMPGFGFKSTDVSAEHGALLNPEQIAAIVAYERSFQ